MTLAQDGEAWQKGTMTACLVSNSGRCANRFKGGRGRGGSGANNGWRERTNKADVYRHNDRYERYYDELNVVADDEMPKLWEAMRRDLPNSFRFTGSRAYCDLCWKCKDGLTVS